MSILICSTRFARTSVLCAAALAAASAWGSAYAQDFEIRFETAGLTAAQQSQVNPVLQNTAAFWESVIVGYQPGVTLNGIDIAVAVQPIDGPNNTLGFGGPGGFISQEAGFTFITDFGSTASQGSITLDSADLNSSALQQVVNHEVAHALGFVSLLFQSNGVYVPDSGQYTGAAGLAAYRDEFDPNATFVPIELDGGVGTANGHLNETFSFGSEENPGPETDPGDNSPAPTVLIEDSAFFGRSLNEDLLTGRINASAFLSNTTVAIFQDLGYAVALPNPVPEPSSLVALAFGGLLAMRRRRQQA